ncbi:MAG: hypothetical protein NC411_00545 [Bacteroides sp.]|nr:hypothetical protein [Bacteroides sp.]
MMNKILPLVAAFLIWMNSHAQTIDEKIANAMNTADWFALDSIYNAAPKDSIHPFLEVYSRCLLGNRLNCPDVSIPAFQELFNTQSDNLDLENLISSTFMFGMDLSRIGQNEAAASMTNSILDATRQQLDSVMISNLTSQANRYSALAAYNPYQIHFDDENCGRVPFVIVPVGPREKGSVLMHLQESSINGLPADIMKILNPLLALVLLSLSSSFVKGEDCPAWRVVISGKVINMTNSSAKIITAINCNP